MTVKGRARRGARRALRLVADAGRAWSADRASRLGAAVAYYSLFALVPVLFLAISLAGLVVGEAVADSAVEERIASVVGSDIAQQIAAAVDQLRAQTNTALLPLLSLGTLVVTASVLFVAWRDVVDLIWGIPRQRGLRASLRRHLFGVLMLVGAGVLLALTIFSETVVGTLQGIVDNAALNALVTFTGSLAPTAIGALFVAVLFEFTPDTDVSWRSVWAPAVFTMVLLSVGAWAYGLYLGTLGFRNASGVAGSLFLGLALVYYATQILLFGVELTKVIDRGLSHTSPAGPPPPGGAGPPSRQPAGGRPGPPPQRRADRPPNGVRRDDASETAERTGQSCGREGRARGVLDNVVDIGLQELLPCRILIISKEPDSDLTGHMYRVGWSISLAI